MSLFLSLGTADAAGGPPYPVPVTTLSVPATLPIGADFSFNVTFDNTSATTTGYGPFIDLVFPATGSDGNDGITFANATYLGQPVTAIPLTFPAGGCVPHPYAKDPTHTPLQVCGTPGDTLVVLQLPFGSFAPAQPPATVVVNAHLSNLADLGKPLTIRTRGGFEFGKDALDNPCCDPSIVNPPDTSSALWPGSPITPTLLTLKKTYIGPENETATGPNFPREYTIDVDIAPGQTIKNLNLTDQLPNNLAYLSLVSSTPAGATLAAEPVPGAAHTTAANILTLHFPSVTGNTIANDADASFTFKFFVPLNDATNSPIIDAANGNDATSDDTASALGDWTPIDTRDPLGVGNASAPGVGHTLTDKSIAIQKGVAIVNDVGAAGYSVGDTLEYTLQFQVSDYFAFQNVIIDDTISDGQHYDPAFTPTFSVDGNSFSLATAAMDPSNVTITPNYTPADPVAPNDGSTALQFRASNELLTRGRPNGRWIGGCVQPTGTGGPTPNCTLYNDGATTATLKFRTVIQDRFTDTYLPNDPFVDSGDHLDNNVSITGDVLSVANLAPTGQTEADTSATSINIVFGNLVKSIYAINGNTTLPSPVKVSPNDTVTYRIQYDLASSDFENLKFIDNLPLPIFDATSITSFDTGFDGTGTAPIAGHYKLGPVDTYHTVAGAVSPALATDGTDNSVTFDYGSFNDPNNQESHIDILFTVLVKDLPFADGLFLTNQVHESDGSTNGAPHEADAIIQLQLTEPALLIKKGVIGSTHTGATLTPPTAGPVGFSAPGSPGARWTGTINSTNLATAPIDSNISGVDAGDRVSFAIAVENRGTSQKGAFDLTITDTLPLGLIIPPSGAGLNMKVTYGDGTPLTFIGLTNGAAAAQDLFGSGIRLDDPALIGACQVYDPTNGKNIIIITYDLQVDPSAPAGVVIPNRATITNYASTEGGPNFVPDDHPSDTATTTVASPSLTKALVGTSITSASNDTTHAVIGELATYTLTMAVPEGQTNSAQIVDTLDAGLAFVDVTAVAASPGVSASLPTVGSSPANTTITGSGGAITFNLGTITNSDSNDAVAETITITYRAVVLNVVGNQTGTQLNNSAALTWANGSQPAVSANNVTLIEPALTIAKTASPTTGDAGDPITFSLTVSNPATGSTDAFDAVLSDAIPSGMTYVPGSLVNFSGPAATLDDTLAPALKATWGTFAPNTSSVIHFQATLNSNVTLAQVITNNATVRWTSILGTPGTISTYNTSSTERTGADGVGGALNDYAATNSASVTVNSVALTKSIVTTSEAHTVETGTGTNASPRLLAIGEIIRYRLAVQLPEGVATDFQLRDNLPNGLTFLNDGTARALFVSNGGGIGSATAGTAPAVTCTNLNGNATTMATLTQAQVNCALADANISTNSATNADTYTSGTDVRFKLGTLTNADNDADAEFVVIEFNALADNSATGSNDAGDNLDNTFNAFVNATTANGSASNNIRATVVEPSIPFNATVDNKTVSPATGDAGDIVTYTLVYTNAAGAPRTDAFDARIVDAVPPAATLNLGSITIVSSGTCTTPTPTNNSAGNNIDITISRVSPGCTITITYQATLTTSVLPGQLIDNTANLTYTSLPGATGTPSGSPGNSTGSSTPGATGTDTGERNGAGGAINDYSGSDTARVTVFVPAPVKSLVSTSEANTTGSNLAVGEIARYRMVVRVAEGSSPTFQLRDNLPAGTTFLNDGTVKVALVSDDPGLSSSTLSGAGLQVLGNETTVNGITPSFVLPGGAISGGPFADGTDPTFSLGNLTNTDSDPNSEYVVVEFNALTGNVTSNQAGTTLNNTFDVFINGGPSLATSNPVATNVVEPSITNLAKTVVPATGDAGDTVTYQLVYTNATGANSTDAFEARIQDFVPTAATLNLGSITIASSGTCITPIPANNSSGNTIDITISRVAPGCTITITYTATLISNVTAGQLIANTANLTYTSLPGTTGTTGNVTGSNTPGVSGSTTGERDGSGGVNDYIGSSTANVTVPTPTLQKLAPTPTSYAVGDTITYDIRVTLPEGATTALKVIDTLPAGLGYVNYTVVKTAAASGGHLTADYNGTLTAAPTVTNAAGVITFDFGTPQTNGSGPATGTSNNQFLVRVTAQVLNVAGNQQGTTLTNSASLTYTHPTSGTTTVTGGSQAVTVIEPVLALNKRILTPAAPADAGGTVTYQATFTNTTGLNTSTAYETRFRDPLPAGLSLNLGSVSVTLSGGATGVTNNSAGNTIDVTIASIPVGGKVTIQYDATLAGSVTPGQTITNAGDVIWSSVSGTVAGERHEGNGNQGGGGLNDYELQSSASFTTLNNPTITKALASTSDANTTGSNVTIGELVTYDLTIRLPEGTTPSLTVVDNLPPGLVYVAGSASIDTTGFNGTVPAPTVTNTGGSGDDVTFSFGSITVTGDNVTTNNSFIVRLQARVMDIAGNVGVNPPGQTSLSNSATLQLGAGAPIATPAVLVTVVEPRIATTKSVTPTTNVQAGTVLTYKVRFTNTGTSMAYDVTATDTLASTTAFSALTGCVDAANAPVPSSATNNGATVDFGGNPAGSWDIPVSGYIECTYTVTAQSAIALEGSYTNTIDADWSSQNGSPTGDRIYDDSTVRAVDGTQDTALATFTTGAPTFSKSDGGTSQVAIGNQITYTLTITSPLGTIRNLVITDTLPIGLIYNTGSAVVTGVGSVPVTASTPNDGSAPVGLKWTFGDTVITSSPVKIVYTATVANTTSNQQAVALTNDAALDHNNAANVPQAPIHSSDGVVIVEPTLTIDKTVTPASANVGDLVTYQMAVANTSAVTAHDVVVTDAIPAGLAYEAGTITIVSGPAGTTNDSGAPNLTWNIPSIPAGQTTVVEFKARLNGSGGPSVANTAGVTWTSTAGTNPNERTGADGPGGALNDYAATDSATLLTSSYIIDKRLVAPASGLAGVNDIVTFSITVTNTGATTLATIPLTDTYDTTYLGYQSATPASDDNTDDGLVNWANVGPLAPGAHTTILVNFKALAVTDSLPGKVTTNRTGVTGAKDSNNTTLITHTSSAPVAIGAPDMRISVTDGKTSTTPNDTLTYTLQVTNTGSYTATGVVITETVPLNSNFAGGSVVWVAQGGGVYTYTVPTPIGIGQSTSVTFIVTVNSAIPAGVTTISDSTSVGDDGAHGPDATPANNSATDTDTLVAAPDLTITKSDGGVSTTPAGVVTYTLTFTNTGNQDATGVVITETVPVNTTFNAGASTATWSCADGSPAGTTCTFNVGNMAVGTSNSVIFAITVDSPLPAGVKQINNTATIADDGTNGPDATPANNSGSDTTPLVNTPDLEITKSDQSLTATPGATVAYTLSYTNTGNIGATGVVITETVSANTNFNAAASTAGWVCTPSNGPGSVCTISVPNVAGGGGKSSVTFAVTVDNPLPAGVTQLNNQASIGDDGTNGSDPTPANNITTDVDTFVNAPDLTITKSDQSLTATPGATVAYTLSYTNTGNIGATGVVITETVSAYSTFNAGASTAGWTCTPSNGPGSVCTINVAGTVAGGGGKGNVTFAVTVDSTLPAGVTQLNNEASIGDDGTNGSEPTPANNITTDVDTLIAAPDLTITKSDGGVTLTPGGTITYTLTFTNTGNQDATGVVLNETVPANTTFVPAKGWICTPDNNAGSSCTFIVGSLAAGASSSQTFVVSVLNPLPAGVKQLANTVTIADDGANGTDPTPANNSSNVNTPVNAGIDLVISKSADALTTAPSGVLIYTLTYTNTGNIGASGVVITEQVPANTTFKPTSSTAGWVCTPNGSAGSTCTLNVGTVAGGNSSGSVTFAVTVANPLPAGVTAIVNSVQISDDGANGAEPTPANNTSAVTTPISAGPDLRLSKHANAPTTSPGAALGYTLAFTNSGSIGATGVVITETVPLNTTYNATVSGATIWSCPNGSGPGTICTTAIPGVVAGAGGSGAVTFGLTIDTPLPSDTVIENTASIGDDGKNGPDPTAVNNVSAAKTPMSKATAIALASFTATRAAQGVVVRWETSAELNTWGFLLYRSADGTRASAVQITPQIVPGQGRGQGGASYSWNDTTAANGVQYSYWLVEVEIDGHQTEYGPASSSVQSAAEGRNHIYMPFIGH